MITDWEWSNDSEFNWGKPYRNRYIFETIDEAVQKFYSLKNFDQFIYFHFKGLKFIITFGYGTSIPKSPILIYVHCQTIKEQYASIPYSRMPTNVVDCINDFYDICNTFIIIGTHSS